MQRTDNTGKHNDSAVTNNVARISQHKSSGLNIIGAHQSSMKALISEENRGGACCHFYLQDLLGAELPVSENVL